MKRFLYAKRDLEGFSPRDISLLADHLGISKDDKDRDDLLWLLALTIHRPVKRSQMPTEKFDPHTLETLPLETLFDIATRFDWPTITRLCQTSQYFNATVCVNDIFWQSFILEKYPEYKKPTNVAWSTVARDLQDIQKVDEYHQFTTAIENGKMHIARFLAKYKPEHVNYDKFLEYRDEPWFIDMLKIFPNALAVAIEFKMFKLANELIAAKKGINNFRIYGETPLMTAVRGGYTELVDKLIKTGANVDLGGYKAEERLFPLYLAIEKGHDEIAQKLIDAGADLDQTAYEGYTPLGAAVDTRNVKLTLALIKAGANVDTPDAEGYTPLDVARIAPVNEEIVDALIAAGAK